MIAAPGSRAFVVPPQLEASEPPEMRGIPRDHVQMLVSERASGNVVHAQFVDLGAYLVRGDLLVVNDSATLPAALDGQRAGGEALTLHLSSLVGGTLWVAEPRGAVAQGEAMRLPAGASATFLAPVDAASRRLWYVRVDATEPFVEYLHAHGRAIRYRYVSNDVGIGAYQTIFARVPGSAEMPSAGRPFTRRVFDDLERRGIEVAAVTLHCGVASPEAHEPPQLERFDVGAGTAERVNRARRSGRRVIAVGTTVVRALESAARGDDVIASAGWTDLVVTAARGVRVVDGILTGLHEPQASHLALLEAFLAPEDLAAAYAAALENRYLWHEFGDVHLIV